MYYILSSEITIAGKKFTRVSEVEIESSTKTLEDTAKIVIPATARLVRDGKYISAVETAKTFKVGDEVVIKLGYDYKLREEFRGFVKSIKPGMPTEIMCEDITYLLKKKPLKKAFRAITLKGLLEYMVHGTPIKLSANVPDITFTHFTLYDTTAAYALQKLKDEYGLLIYFRNYNELHVSMANDNNYVTVKYEMGANVVDADLEWQEADDIKVKIKAVYIDKKNKKVIKYFPSKEAEGEEKTIFTYTIPKGADLEKLARNTLAKYRYTGYKGSLTAFLIPNIDVGNTCKLHDPHFSERDGSYIVDKVTTTYNDSGARRKVELGIKVSGNNGY